MPCHISTTKGKYKKPKLLRDDGQNGRKSVISILIRHCYVKEKLKKFGF